MLTISIDRSRISHHFKANVIVQSDVPFTAYEARATITNESYGKGIGFDLLSDDSSSSGGVVTLSSPVTSVSFDVESYELEADGNYRISVYVRDESEVWNDCCQLYTSSGEEVKDSDGRNVLAKREDGTQQSYTSAYSGNEINNFITEVLYG